MSGPVLTGDRSLRSFYALPLCSLCRLLSFMIVIQNSLHTYGVLHVSPAQVYHSRECWQMFWPVLLLPSYGYKDNV